MRFVFIFFIAVFLYAKKSYYTIQVISSPSKEKIMEFFNRYKYKIPHMRVEKIGNFYTVRVGLYKDYEKAKKEYNYLKKIFKHPLLRKGYYIKSRIIASNDKTANAKYLDILSDKALVDLIIKTYLANAKIEKLKNFLEKVIKRYPNEEYLSLYAQVLLWNREPKESMQMYYKLFLKYKKRKYAKKAFKLAFMFKEYTLAYKLLPYVKAKKEQKIFLYNALGDIERLILTLKHSKNKKDLQRLAEIYYLTGQPEKALRVLEKIKKEYGLSCKYVLLMANIYFSLKEYSKAKQVLKEHISKAGDYFPYWENLFSLSLMLDDKKTAYKAALKLLNDPNDTYSKNAYIFLVNYTNNPEKSLFYAKEGWRKFHLDIFLSSMFEGYFNLKKYKKIIALYQKHKKFVNSTKSLYYIYLKALFKTDYKKALRIASEYLNKKCDVEIFSLYFQNVLKRSKKIDLFLKKYSCYESKVPEIFVSAYLYLQKGYKALNIYRKYNIQNLYLYANILDVLGMGESRKIKRELFEELKNKKTFDQNELINFLSLAVNFYSMPKLEELFKKYKKDLPERIWKMLYINALLYHGRIEVAKRYKNYEPWMSLSIALYKKDQYFIRDILNQFSNLPLRDKISALSFIGEKKRALNYAFRGLENNPCNVYLYKQFRDLAVDESYFQINPEYVISDDYDMFENDLEVFLKDVEGFNIKLKTKYKKITSKTANLLITNFTNTQYSAEMSKKIKKLLFGVMFFKTDKKDSKNGYGFWMNYPFENFNMDFRYVNAVSSDENIYQLLNSFKTGAKLRLNYFKGRYVFGYLYEFYNIYFGDKKAASKSYNEADFTVYIQQHPKLKVYFKLFKLDYFNKKTVFEYLKNSSYIVFDNDYGIGCGVGFGDKEFVSSFRVFGDIYLQSSKTNPFAYSLNAGIKRALFGSDNIIFETSYSNTSQNNKNYIINLIYKRLF